MLSGKVETGSFVLFWEYRLPSSNPPMIPWLLNFCLIVDACAFVPDATREVCNSRGDVWVGLYLIYYFSGASGWLFWWVSTSGHSCCHVEGPPFVNFLSYSGWMELESFGDGLIALPRLMGCHYPLLHVIGYLLYSWHCWFVWDHSGLVWFLSLLISAGQTLSQGCLVCLNDLLSTQMWFTWICYLLDLINAARGSLTFAHTLIPCFMYFLGYLNKSY